MAKINLSKDFKEFIELLNFHKVRFIVVGGYAVGFHGYVRFTGDIDIWIDSRIENAENLLKALDQFGFGSVSGISLEDFVKDNSVVQLGYPPFRIDIMTSLSGITFDQCYTKREVTAIDGIEVPFIDLDSLKINKASTNRKKDLGDLDNLP
jgi:hypothetical protein